MTLNHTNVSLPTANKTAYSFIVIDKLSGKQATKTIYASRIAATRARDRLDNAWGSYKYAVKSI